MYLALFLQVLQVCGHRTRGGTGSARGTRRETTLVAGLPLRLTPGVVKKVVVVTPLSTTSLYVYRRKEPAAVSLRVENELNEKTQSKEGK